MFIVRLNKLDDIHETLKNADSLPFLFVGSGMSKRYRKIPLWKDLLKDLAKLVDSSPYYFARLEREVSRDYNEKSEYNQYNAALCDLISKDLDSQWFENEKFEKSRQLYGDRVVNEHIPPIKVEVARIISSYKNVTGTYDHELECLKKMSSKSISGVITTNYDDIIESIFQFTTYTSQEDLLFHSKYDLAEIYKIHGTVEDPASIMINSDDYKLIEQKHKYISAKLLTIFVEHPVFFLGYSIGDEDIRSILMDIQESLGEEQVKKVQDRFFFVDWDPNIKDAELSDYTISFENGSSITMTKISLSNYSELFNILSENKTKYPVKMLRYAKQDIYKYSLSSEPSKKAVFWLPNKELTEEEMSNVEFMYGFGIIERAENGYDSVHYVEFYEDVVFDNKDFENNLVVTKSLPIALRASSGWMPIRKYVQNVPEDGFPNIVKNNLQRFDSINSQLSQALKKRKKKKGSPTPSQALAAKGQELQDMLAIANWNKDNIGQLGDYLRRVLKPGDDFVIKSSIKRLVRIYDFVKYGQ